MGNCINVNIFFFSFQYFSSMNIFILKKYIAWKRILAPRSVEISTGPAGNYNFSSASFKFESVQRPIISLVSSTINYKGKPNILPTFAGTIEIQWIIDIGCCLYQKQQHKPCRQNWIAVASKHYEI